jgi:hypothetical protein
MRMSTMRLLTFRLVLTVVVVLALAPNAMASVGVGSNAAAPTLKVDAQGNAEISYTQAGARKTVLVPVKGAVVYGVTLTSPDVSKAASSPKLPYLKVLRSGPNGWLYALQTWPARIGPPELRFSRWQGAPTKLTFTATQQHLGIALEGKVTYAGKPIPTSSPAPGGIKIREYVYIDQQVGGKWKVLGGVTVKSNGTYRRILYGVDGGDGFRASVAGPNIGSVYAPDMVLQIPPP